MRQVLRTLSGYNGFCKVTHMYQAISGQVDGRTSEIYSFRVTRRSRKDLKARGEAKAVMRARSDIRTTAGPQKPRSAPSLLSFRETCARGAFAESYASHSGSRMRRWRVDSTFVFWNLRELFRAPGASHSVPQSVTVFLSRSSTNPAPPRGRSSLLSEGVLPVRSKLSIPSELYGSSNVVRI